MTKKTFTNENGEQLILVQSPHYADELQFQIEKEFEDVFINLKRSKITELRDTLTFYLSDIEGRVDVPTSHSA